MRHRVAKKTLNRTSAHRKALARNLSEALIIHGKIETTVNKAKFVKPYIEKVITRTKNTDKISVFNTVKYLRTKLFTESVIKKLLEEVAPMFEKRKGGYTRIVKTGNRDGDNAMMARLELVETKKKENTKDDQKAKLKAKTKGKKVEKKEIQDEQK